MSRKDDWLDNWQTEYSDPADPLKLRFRTFVDGSAATSFMTNGGRQEWTMRFVPEDNGMRIWMTLLTQERIPGGYVVQQCLRLGSDIGFGFRGSVAHTPFLSELLMQLLGNANGTMTWMRSDGKWLPFPVPFTRYHTAAGQGVYEDSCGQIDQGLIVRESAPRDKAPASYWRDVAPDATWKTWSAALYWERSAFVSNRHPADCIHAGVDFGPLDAGEARTIQGKFYWLEGTKDDVLATWEKEWLNHH